MARKGFFPCIARRALSCVVSGMIRLLVLASSLLFFTVPNAHALSDKELESIGRRVWQNECAGTRDGLTSWNSGEGFPSLGIGHFIWYPKGVSGPFEESFPSLVQFLESNGVKVPSWIRCACPWASREEFNSDLRGARLTELRELLAGTVRLQSRFLARRMEAALPKLLAAAPAAKRAAVRRNFERLAASGKGTFALIDYVNFKGEGTNPKERYKGEGWGLLQVIEGMAQDVSPCRAFSESAARVLTRRVKNAENDESRWLKGWMNRVRSYAE